MKYLLLAGVIFVVYMIWRSGRASSTGDQESRADSLNKPQDMVRCNFCAVHLPASDAVSGRLGSYCSKQHRDQKEG